MGGTPVVRAFVAVNLSENLVEAFRVLLSDLKNPRLDVKWIEPEKIHLTLKFLGNVEEASLESYWRALEEAVGGHSSFPMTLKGLGAFPNLRRPRVIWVGAFTPEDSLTKLQKAVEEAFIPLGFPAEERPFAPHLTLGRVRTPKNLPQLSQSIQERQDFYIGEMKVQKVSFMKSTLTPKGAIYQELKGFPLA